MNRTRFGLSPEETLEGLRRDDRRAVAGYYHYLRERVFGIFCHCPQGHSEGKPLKD